jgi:DegV family protein with EDD domain
VVTDSTADIPDELVETLKIGVVYDYINFGTQSLRDKLDISRSEFYSRLESESVLPTTAAPGVGEFEAAFRQAGAPDVAIVSIHPPAHLSALYNTALLAAQAFPEGCVTVIDSGQITMGMGWMVVAAARAAQAHQPLEAIVDLVISKRVRTRVVAALDTFEYLRRSGRVSWAQMVVGTLLRIKPMIQVGEGQILPLDRVRTIRRAMTRLVELTEALAPVESLAILHSDWPAGADELRRRLSHIGSNEPLLTVDVTPVLGVHVGPRGIGVAVVSSAEP